MSTAQTLPTVFSGSNTGWEGSSTPSSPRNNAAPAPTGLPDSYYRTLRHFFGQPPEVSR